MTVNSDTQAGSVPAFELFDNVVFEISPMLALPFLARRIFVIVRRQERRVEIQMRQVRFNRQAEPGSEMSSHNRRPELLRWNLSVVRLQFLDFVIFVKQFLLYTF